MIFELGAVWTVTFLNKNVENPTPTVWVCENKAAYKRSLAKLGKLPHIEVVQSGPSHYVEL